MKNKSLALIVVALAVAFFSSCRCCNPAPPKTTSGIAIQDSSLNNVMLRLVHSGSVNYLAYYFTPTLVVDTTKTPAALTIMAQSARYDSTNESFVLHNGKTSSQISSQISLYTDTVKPICCGPFDVTNGKLFTSKGYLHYSSKTITDSTICPISTIVYINQTGTGKPATIGYVAQGELHSPNPLP